MTLGKIKKALYKENPIATRVKIITVETAVYDGEGTSFAPTGVEKEDIHFYRADLKDGSRIFFRIPVSEMGEKQFAHEEESQLLIRWIAFNT